MKIFLRPAIPEEKFLLIEHFTSEFPYEIANLDVKEHLNFNFLLNWWILFILEFLWVSTLPLMIFSPKTLWLQVKISVCPKIQFTSRTINQSWLNPYRFFSQHLFLTIFKWDQWQVGHICSSNWLSNCNLVSNPLQFQFWVDTCRWVWVLDDAMDHS